MENCLSFWPINTKTPKFKHASSSHLSEPSCRLKLLITDKQLQLSFSTSWASSLMLKYSYKSSLQFAGIRAMKWRCSEWNLYNFSNPISRTSHWRGFHEMEEKAIHTSDFFPLFFFPLPRYSMPCFWTGGWQTLFSVTLIKLFLTVSLNSCSFNKHLFWKMIQNMVINSLFLSPVTVKNTYKTYIYLVSLFLTTFIYKGRCKNNVLSEILWKSLTKVHSIIQS